MLPACAALRVDPANLSLPQGVGSVLDYFQMAILTEKYLVAIRHLWGNIMTYVPGGSKSLKGFLITFAKDHPAAAAVMSLPHLHLPLIHPRGHTDPDDATKTLSFEVRHYIVRGMLQYLLMNNPAYAGASISPTDLYGLPANECVETTLAVQRDDPADAPPPPVTSRGTPVGATAAGPPSPCDSAQGTSKHSAGSLSQAFDV